MTTRGTTNISIALATYNGERFLKQQLDSLMGLEPAPAEVAVCDDGSTDTTMEILEKFRRRAQFPVIIRQNTSNLGWRANFFQVVGLCTSELIAFCDQDDTWYPHKLGVIAPLFLDPDMLLVHHDADLIDEVGAFRGRLRDGEDDKEKLLRLSKPTIWSHAPGLTMVFRRSLLVFNPYWPDSVDPGKPTMPAAHDQWMYHLASNLGVVRFVDEPLVGYRQHTANQVGFHAKRHHAFSSPKALKDEIAVHADMLAGFRKALQNALVDGRTGFEAQLPAAIEANQSLQRRLLLRSALYQEGNAIRRLVLFLRLLRSGAYKRTTHWNLGRRSLIADFRAVLLQPI